MSTKLTNSETTKKAPVMAREHHAHSYAYAYRHKAEEEGITQYCCWCGATRNVKIRFLGPARELGRGCNTVFCEDELHSPGPWDHECIEHPAGPATYTEIVEALRYARRFLNKIDQDTDYIDEILGRAEG